MRRGRSGIGGWSNENPRHFRPRGGGNPHFRTSRNIPRLENIRFPPPGPRTHHGSYPYNTQPSHLNDYAPPTHHDRSKYRINNLDKARMEDRKHYSQPRQILPLIQQNVRHSDNFFEDVCVEQCAVNSMGDIDHRQLNIPNSRELYRQRSATPRPPQRINPWDTTFDKNHFYADASLQKNYRHQEHNEGNKVPITDYAGHRPPSSDHYDATPGPMTNNNNTSFSRSVDDTVDIVRRRLMNRNESQSLSEDNPVDQPHEDQGREILSDKVSQEPPTKKRIQRNRQNVKSNCDKMKTQIVHQLFKMDKDKMHKLMDDPGSSTKFEYAISSLITESQNSLNRHMRSVAEKSLYSSSTDFIHNDNNTIYEDTFMKQMQCLLDPQDTVLLEDIKPMVMAELSKVLQLDDFEQRYDAMDYQGYPINDQPPFPYYDSYNYEGYPQETFDEQNQFSTSNFDNPDSVNPVEDIQSFHYNQETEYTESKPLFERRGTSGPSTGRMTQSDLSISQKQSANRRSPERNEDKTKVQTKDNNRRILRTPDRRILLTPERRESTDRKKHTRERTGSVGHQRQRISFDKPIEPTFSPPEPLFDTNAERLTDDEDPFAELDKQYHVAVDHTFIQSDDIPSMTMQDTNEPIDKQSPNIKKEVDNQIPAIVETPVKVIPFSSKDENVKPKIKLEIKKELVISPEIAKENSSPVKSSNNEQRLEHVDQSREHAAQPKKADKETEQSQNIVVKKSSSPPQSRKRSIDQRPSHRKEKRKKSESSQPDTNKQILNKNIIINVNDCAAKSTETCKEAAKSIFNLFFSKGDGDKETLKDSKKKAESSEKGYSDKYVKRKENLKKSKENEITANKKRSSSTSSHSRASPNDSQTSSKQDAKTKLQTIDMFMDQPKKLMVHQAHRNTAVNTVPAPKPIRNESKPITINKMNTQKVVLKMVQKLQSKETQTTENKKISRICQTERKKLAAKWVQTEPVTFGKPISKSTDAFERMKEIDMEIQVLLQEKFKLYSSLESRDSFPSTMPSLGMTVLSVTPHEENTHDGDMSADTIVDDFTNIPVEELEKIALESVQETSPADKRGKRRQVIQEEKRKSQSPTSAKKINRKARTPNISLIEQIITDDRPLEDIISLDDLEEPQEEIKIKKKPLRPKQKKKAIKKTKSVKKVDYSSYDLKKCSVLLVRADISSYFQKHSKTPDKMLEHKEPSSVYVEFEVPTIENDPIIQTVEENHEPEQTATTEVIEEAVENDLQFDMLDVSEDIVIGDMCEIKFTEDADSKDTHGRVQISDEIILDNSQSSCDDAIPTDAGQVENVCKTYDYSTDENLRRDSVTVTGNADAVLAIECIENNFIAACLDGNVYHFSSDGQLLNMLRGSNLAVTCLTIVKEKYGTTVYTGSLDSRIRYYDLETGMERGPECNVLSPIQTMDRAWDTIFVGTRTGFVLQFECKNNMLIPVSTVKFSDQSILALRAMKEGPRKVLLVAARSENVTVKDAQTGLLLRTLVGPKMTVYTLLFEDGKVYCGTSSHQIHVFDYASGSHAACHEGGKGAVCLRASGGLLFAGCYDGCVYVFREGDARPMAQLRGPGLMLLSLAIVGSKIIAGYKDRSLYIWKIPLCILQEMIL